VIATIARPARFADEHFHYFVGTRAFSSSNQLSTTRICGAAAAPNESSSDDETTPTNLPSGNTSYALVSSAVLFAITLAGRFAGVPNVTFGCVATLTAASRPDAAVGT
jgi:hypothetical protein